MSNDDDDDGDNDGDEDDEYVDEDNDIDGEQGILISFAGDTEEDEEEEEEEEDKQEKEEEEEEEEAKKRKRRRKKWERRVNRYIALPSRAYILFPLKSVMNMHHIPLMKSQGRMLPRVQEDPNERLRLLQEQQRRLRFFQLDFYARRTAKLRTIKRRLKGV
ncbi:uncharacterized protein [Procambarus clarkii]|uniref:uncharacterized protein n=1 Tax=Procambarus clarkii TaxID=6728 RepID=UPI003742ED2B